MSGQIDLLQVNELFLKINCYWVKGFMKSYLPLINIWQMFNLGTSDLAVKPNIPHKSLLQFVANALITWVWSFWPLRLWRLLEAKNIIYRCTLWQWDQLWLSASISRILEPSPQCLIFSSYKTKVSRDILRLRYDFRKALTPLWQLHVNVNLVQYIMYAQWFHEMNILCFDQILSKYSWEHPWNTSTFVYGCITYTPLPLQCKQYFTAKFWSIFDPSPWHCHK